MLIEAIHPAKLRVCLQGQGEMLQAIWPSRYDKNKKFTQHVLYLGTREMLGFDKCLWGRQYALVEGKIMIIDRDAWRYIQPVG